LHPKRAENKLTLNVKFIEIVYVAHWVLTLSSVVMKNKVHLQWIEKKKEISPGGFSSRALFTGTTFLLQMRPQRGPSATATECNEPVQDGHGLFYNCGSNIHTHVYLKVRHEAKLGIFWLFTRNSLLFGLRLPGRGFCLRTAVSASLLLIFRMAN